MPARKAPAAATAKTTTNSRTRSTATSTPRAAASKASTSTRAAAKPAAKPATPARRTAAAKPAPAPKAATPARASRKPASKPVDDEPDLLASLNEDADSTSDDGEDDDLDLLSQIGEEAGTPWCPWSAGYEDQPQGIQGKVQHRGTVTQDEKYGGGDVNYLEILDRDGETLWSVRGYATVLDGQIEKKDPQVGDTIAIAYRGLKANRKGDNDYHDFGVLVRAGR